jgi:hypothetical protein
MSGELGERFAKALAAKDAVALRALLQEDVNFRGMTPQAFWEANDAATLVDDILLGKWFEPTDEIVDLFAVETATVGRCHRVGYRLKVRNPDGEYLAEQQAYFESEDGRIGWLRVMCAGFQRSD